ncbi:uncharacterized protein MCYG_01702 [Microsporum canis CBS 113480]|uniref:Uncharacterized protein n=1 Tax=Arthroderma otae (strain ATCC MYA-4605 / CBS 113480) TaxID=554155 RepID=C5FHQ3_ARTOC|nr:uncharacterized protein MCYG_01702 [Microsporum canis CBS 113480]EEQ28883.1 predicted protein [Microsporum canis CBS 113480]
MSMPALIPEAAAYAWDLGMSRPLGTLLDILNIAHSTSSSTNNEDITGRIASSPTARTLKKPSSCRFDRLHGGSWGLERRSTIVTQGFNRPSTSKKQKADQKRERAQSD